MREKIWRWVANRLPKRLVYFATIRIWGHATSGDYSDTLVPSVTVIDALKRWSKE